MASRVALLSVERVAEVALHPAFGLRAGARSALSGRSATGRPWVAEVALVVVPPQMRAHTHVSAMRKVRHKCHPQAVAA